jgi:hypothetical protein
MASNSLIFIPSFVRISQLVQNQIMQKRLVQVYTKCSQNRSVLSEVKHAKNHTVLRAKDAQSSFIDFTWH